MKFIIVTGMSGAGKSSAINFFEDMGYYCVDNLPPTLIKSFADLIVAQQNKVSRVVLGMILEVVAYFLSYTKIFKNYKNMVILMRSYSLIAVKQSLSNAIKKQEDYTHLHAMSVLRRAYEKKEKY